MPEPILDATFFKPFVDATLNTLKVQCNIEVQHGKPFVKGAQPPVKFQIAGVIGLTSDKFSGNITLCFTEKFFLALMSNMLGEEFKTITKDLEDGAAELLNIIFGSAKAILNTQGHTIQKAIPTVITGDSIATTHLQPEKVIVLPFKADSGDFHIEISTDTKSA